VHAGEAGEFAADDLEDLDLAQAGDEKADLTERGSAADRDART
jgi:hypothetical protein